MADDWTRIKCEIERRWDEPLLGQLVDCVITPLTTSGSRFVDISFNATQYAVELFVSTLAAAVSTKNSIGAATDETLDSVKKRIDITAAHAFREVIERGEFFKQVAVSEAKDEFGEIVPDPLAKLVSTDKSRYSLAVDVVDGTTLTAKGLPGAYSLAAAAKGLQRFPDLRAYAIMAPGDVLDVIDWEMEPEDVVPTLIAELCKYNGSCQPRDIRVVTHSFDIGQHHKMLIKALQQAGVEVIVPDVVIVEAPYVLSTALGMGKAPHAMIGVFGLPEVVINTLLLGILATDYRIDFRIASNMMLKDRQENTLRARFNFSDSEHSTLQDLQLPADTVYDFETICAADDLAFFAATALTHDHWLGLEGLQQRENQLTVNSILCTGLGNIYQIVTTHQFRNKLDYSARYALALADISLVACMDPHWAFSILTRLQQRIEEAGIRKGLRFAELLPGEAASGLHVTVFEFGTHFGGLAADKVRRVFDALHAQLSGRANSTGKRLSPKIDEMKLVDGGIIMNINVDEQNYRALAETCIRCAKDRFCNIIRTPHRTHITLARFIEYLDTDELTKIHEVVRSFNRDGAIVDTPLKYNLALQSATSTPFTKLNASKAIGDGTAY